MEYGVMLVVVAAGALTVLRLRLDQPRFVRLFNAFTGSYLLCLSFLHLVPGLYGAVEHGHDQVDPVGSVSIGVLVLVGFFAQVLLEGLSMGAEHGHAHAAEGHAHGVAEGHGHGGGGHSHGQVVQLGVVVGLCLHAMIEATAIGDVAHHHDQESRSVLLWSIAVHKYPVTVAFFGSLLQTGIPRARAFIILGVFAAMAPIGLFLGAHTPLAEHSRELTALVVGIFMHVATTVLFETTESHRFNVGKFIAILVGIGAGALTLLAH
ncbi:MAG: ZIP family metal transporter [Verrucomicrobiae bacterium]|nr:ZIP family metal transporter [Verrucomicrobiae bacterium]MCP5523143.1 ZIP family metal transporter [Verrucomicrobiales bacterium]